MMEKPFTVGDIALIIDMANRGIPADVIAQEFYDASTLDILWTIENIAKGERESLEQRQAMDDKYEQNIRASYSARGYSNIY